MFSDFRGIEPEFSNGYYDGQPAGTLLAIAERGSKNETALGSMPPAIPLSLAIYDVCLVCHLHDGTSDRVETEPQIVFRRNGDLEITRASETYRIEFH